MEKELIVDNFAGGGGASTGIEAALCRPVDIAINHDRVAIEMHRANHPGTKHFCESVWDINPKEVCKGRRVGLAWFSPDCKHFSKAKGGRPVEKKIRGLAWVAIRWAALVKPRVIILENVEEFETWGPVKGERPDPSQKGRTFRCFLNALKSQGYKAEYKTLVAADCGTPTIRKRLFLIARCDGQPIVWPEKTHAPAAASGLLPWVPASSIIDWSIPCPSIFDRKRPLAEATLRRIAKGLEKFVFSDQAQDCFFTEFANSSHQRNMPANVPLRTICAEVKGGHFALVKPFISRQFGKSVGASVDSPLGTITAGGGGKSVLVNAFFTQFYGNTQTRPVQEPLGAITAGGRKDLLIKTFLTKYYGNGGACPLSSPLDTVTTRDRFGLVEVKGTTYQITDIGLRMLTPRELYNAQGFPASYIIDRGANGKRLTKTEQIQKAGNSVCPPVAEAIVKANMN